MLEETAPLYETFLYRPQRKQFDKDLKSGVWHRKIDHLMAAGYGFKAEQFSSAAYLCRGMSNGFRHALEKGVFAHFNDNAQTNIAEQIMEIFFVTHQLSDAVSASKIHTGLGDNGIILFNSNLFNLAIEEGAAAIMEIGDMGVIFRYPFLSTAIKLEQITAIFTHEENAWKMSKDYSELAPIIYAVPEGQQQANAYIENVLQVQGWSMATVEPGLKYPDYRLLNTFKSND